MRVSELHSNSTHFYVGALTVLVCSGDSATCDDEAKSAHVNQGRVQRGSRYVVPVAMNAVCQSNKSRGFCLELMFTSVLSDDDDHVEVEDHEHEHEHEHELYTYSLCTH